MLTIFSSLALSHWMTPLSLMCSFSNASKALLAMFITSGIRFMYKWPLWSWHFCLGVYYEHLNFLNNKAVIKSIWIWFPIFSSVGAISNRMVITFVLLVLSHHRRWAQWQAVLSHSKFFHPLPSVWNLLLCWEDRTALMLRTNFGAYWMTLNNFLNFSEL